MDSPQKRIGKVEIWVGSIVFIALLSISIPVISVILTKPVGIETMYHMHGLQLATQTVTIENERHHDPVRWTCSNSVPITFAQWTNSLTNAGMSPADIRQHLAITDRHLLKNVILMENGITAYAVTSTDATDTILFATKNWHGPDTKTLSPQPYDGKIFVVMKKSGEGKILKSTDLQNTTGTGGSHHYLPLQ